MRKFALIFTTLAFLFSLTAPVYAAADPGDVGGGSRSGGSDTGEDISGGIQPPELKDIITPIIRVVNIALAGGAILFVILLFWSGYRYSLAQGDPKAMVLAKESLTHAIQGFLIVVGAYTIIAISTSVFGIDQDIFTGKVGESSSNALQELQDFFDIAQ